jgi:hypothetical protein
MKPSTIRTLLGKLIPAREPALLVGAPGVGKTATVEQLAEDLGYDLIVTHPVVDDPTDYKGMPAVVDHNGERSAQFLPFGDLWKMIEAKRDTIVFMDDLGQAPPAVQAAIMQLVLARRINGHAVSEHVRFLAATNRREDRAAVTGLITPLLDRFTTVLPFDFDLEDWIRWGLQNEMPAPLMGFARFKPDLIGKFEATKKMEKNPTPRSLAGMGRLLNLGIEEHAALSGATGEAFATEFIAFYNTYKELPDRAEIYLNPDGVPVPDRADVLYALMGSLAHGANGQNFEQTVRYLNRCPAEFSVLCVKDSLARTSELKSSRAFIEWATSHASVFGFDS